MKENISARPHSNSKPSASSRAVIMGLVILVVTVVGLVSFLLISTDTLEGSIAHVSEERQQALVAILARFHQDLAILAKDYTIWDETWSFVEQPDPEWAADNLDWLIEGQGLSGVLVLTRDGSPVYENGVFRAWPQESRTLALEHFLQALAQEPAAEAHLYQPQEQALYLLAGSRIVHDEDLERQGEYNGFLILARQLSPEDWAYAEEVAAVSDIKVHLPAGADVPLATANAAAFLGSARPWGERVGNVLMHPISATAALSTWPYRRCYLPLTDYLGPPGVELVYDVDIPLVEAHILRWRWGMLLSGLGILLSIVSGLLAVQRLGLRPLLGLNKAISHFAQSGDWQPPQPRYREFQVITDAISEAIEKTQAAEQSERRRAEELRLLFDNLPAYVFIKDRDGRYLTVNRRMAELFNTSEAEIVGKTAYDLFPPEVARQLQDNDLRVLTSGEPLEIEETLVIAGRVLHVQALKVPLRAPSGEIIGLVGLIFDLSERRKLEEALRQSQKLEAIGKLAGGVAHDFNNILTSIMAGVDLALLQVSPGSDLNAELADVRQAAERAAQLTRQLLFLSRSKSAEKQRLDANEVIKDLSKMLCRLLGEDIALELQLCPQPATILADRTQIEQVLLNLAVNARDAMPTGGSLSIKTGIVGEPLSPSPSPAKGGEASPPSPLGKGAGGLGQPHLLLSVSDTGTGIAPELRERIFDLFFTTKDKGTGLGLSVVQGIVEEHQGAIWFDTEVGVGTSFYVALPLVAEALTQVSHDSTSSPSQAGQETILLVEDDDAVRMLTERVLSKHGYQVAVASSADEALQMAASMSPPPALLISDIVMPGMNGFDLAQALLRHQPSLKVLLTSGYSEQAIAERSPSMNGHRILAKPYTPASLTQAIRELLDKT